MNCAVLGGGGFLGSHLSEALLAGGHTVRVFDQPAARFLPALEQAGATLVKGNFLDPAALRRALTDCELVYHLISTTVPQTSNENPLYDVEANILGTLRMLEIARELGIRKIVFSSSGGTVYGIPQEIPIKETHPTEPTSSYGISKLTIEKYLHLYHNLHGLDYRVLRIANAYGERQPTTGTQGVIGAFLEHALQDSELTVWGDGSVIRDYTYVGDIVEAFLRVSVYDGEHRVFNIGDGRGHSLNELLEIVEQVVGRPLKVKYLPGRGFDIPVNVLDISRARLRLPWQPSVGILEGISRAYEWRLRQPGAP